MDLVQVDYVALQPAQAGFQFTSNRVLLEAFGNLAILIPDSCALGEHVGLVGNTVQSLRHHFFGVPESVDRGCVDPVDPVIERFVNRCDRVLVILRAPRESPPWTTHGPRSYANRGYVQIAIS